MLWVALYVEYLILEVIRYHVQYIELKSSVPIANF